MAISTNILLKGVKGSINKQLVVRQYGSKTVISSYPDFSRHKPTPKQQRRQEIMRLANQEVRVIMSDDSLRNAAQLRLDVPRNKLHHALLKEFLKKLDAEQK